MLKITIEQTESSFRIRLDGQLSEEWADEFKKVWLESAPQRLNKSCGVDLSGVTFIDGRGRSALQQVITDHAELIGGGPMTSYIVQKLVAGCRVLTPAAGRLIFFMAMLLQVAGIHPVLAQEPAALRLSLQEAVRLALQQNPQIQIGSLHLAQAVQDCAIAASDLLPHAGAQVSDAAVRGNSEALIGRKIPFFPQQIGPYQLFEAGAGVSAPVFDLTLWRKWQASQSAARGVEAQDRTIREQITLLVVSQYLGCLRAKAALQAADSRIELARTLHKLASDLQENGVGTGIDTLRANVQVQAEKQRRIVIETQLKTGLLGLARLLNIDPGRKIELAGDGTFESAVPSNPPRSLEEAMAARPEMDALRQRTQAVEKLRSAASDARLPSMKASAAWAYQGTSISNTLPVYEYRLTMNLPLFTGGRIKAERAKADLELKKTAQERQELRNQIVLQVRVAEAEIESARNEVEVTRLSVSLAREEVAQSRDRFEAGIASNLEVVSAQNELARATDSEINALYRLSQAQADLARATGQIEAIFSK
jgi:outer membrane protein